MGMPGTPLKSSGSRVTHFLTDDGQLSRVIERVRKNLPYKPAAPMSLEKFFAGRLMSDAACQTTHDPFTFHTLAGSLRRGPDTQGSRSLL
jgi:hypothetical protein